MASHNVLLGDFFVEELAPNRPDGLTDVTVSFQIDVNGILNVTVTERASGKQVSERLKADRQRLSPEQIAESQAKLAAIYGDEDLEGEDQEEEAEGVELDPGVHALLERGRQVVARPDLDYALAEAIRRVMEQLQLAAEDDEPAEVEELCNELIDLLFEVEEE